MSQITAIIKFRVIPTCIDKFANCAPFWFDLRRGESDVWRLVVFTSPSLSNSDDRSSESSSHSFSESENRPGYADGSTRKTPASISDCFASYTEGLVTPRRDYSSFPSRSSFHAHHSLFRFIETKAWKYTAVSNEFNGIFRCGLIQYDVERILSWWR